MLIKSLIALAISLVITLVVYPKYIPFLRKIHFGQSIREEGPQSHQKKAGTPTMGGLVFIVSTLISVLIIEPAAFLDIDFLVVIFAFVGYGLIGFIDDYLIVVKKNNKGLKPSVKFLMQSALAVIFYLIYRNYTNSLIIIPFTNIKIDLGWFYAVVVFFMFTGGTNAVNLADGLDGLCAGLTILAIIPFIYFCYRIQANSTLVLLVALIGSLIGYLKFNKHPAQIFMGDTGSLALGGVLAAVAMITKEEVALILIGGVFVCETLSVMIQVISFKTTGKRIFKMSPIHHHFELSGWPEQKIVYTFWAVGLILSIIGLLMAWVM